MGKGQSKEQPAGWGPTSEHVNSWTNMHENKLLTNDLNLELEKNVNVLTATFCTKNTDYNLRL